MANTSAIWQQAAHTTYQLSSPSYLTKSHTKKPNLFWKGKRRKRPLAEKNDKHKEQDDQEEKMKRGDKKADSNDSPEIPDRRWTSNISGLPSGDDVR